MFPDRRAQLEVFLRACKADPEDDVPRLILADWLQDQGDARGELVHLQVRRASLRDEGPEAEALRRRELRLLAQHCLPWLGSLVDRASEWSFWRGLVALEARAERFVAPEVFALAGREELLWVEELRLAEVEMHHLVRLSETRVLDDLATLDLADNNLGRAVGNLARVPALTRLRALRLRNNHIGDLGAVALADCPLLTGLRVLDLSRNRIGGFAAAALAESPYLDNLLALDLRGNAIDTEGVDLLRARFGGVVRLGRAAG